MSKLKAFFLCTCLYVSAAYSAMAAPPKYKLSFAIKGLEHKVCLLGFYYGDKTYISLDKNGKDDTVVADAHGSFTFSRDTTLQPGIYFVLTRTKKSFQFIIDKEQKFSIEGDTAGDFITNLKAKESPENSMFFDYLRYVTVKHLEAVKYEKQKNSAMIDSVNREVQRYKDDFVRKHPDMLLSTVFKANEEPVLPPTPKLPNGRPDSTFPYRYYKAHFFDHVNFSDGRLVRTPVLFPLIKEYLDRLTMPIPDSVIVAADYLVGKAKANREMFKFVVAYITNKYETSNIMGMDAVFVHMADNYYTPDQAYWVSPSQLEKLKERAAQLKPVLIGKHVPPLALPDTSLAIQVIDSVRARYTVLYFWDYDCGFCQKETPKLVKWYDSAKAQGIEVYAVETNENELAKWKDYIRKNNLDWINVADRYHTSNFHHVFAIVSTPVVYVLDENKNIIAKNIDVSELNKVIKHDIEIQNAKRGKN